MTTLNLDSVENYYQRLVFQYIISEYGDSDLATNPGALEDVACLALNQLPARYVRHTVDTAFYITVDEQREMIDAVRSAVNRAVEYVREHPREPMTGKLPEVYK